MSRNRLEQLFQFLEGSPEDPFLLFAIAKEYEKQENWEQTLEYYLKIVSKTPDYIGVYYHLGKLYEILDQLEKAFHTYKKGMNIARTAGDQHALSELAAAKLNLGDDEDFED